mmetsp:Transcript_4989/g.11620  ORF Transcript_4989/g.11620 Transcript_4989/m.11620 type:complete len:186 (-) Transcript_4989:108-665(-)
MFAYPWPGLSAASLKMVSVKTSAESANLPTLVVTCLSGEKLAAISLVRGMSFQQVKEAVARASTVPVSEQKLIIDGKVLDSDAMFDLLGSRCGTPDHEVNVQLVRVSSIAGTHLGKCCTCIPGPSEVCWGYHDCVKDVCPGCSHKITSKKMMTTDGCRHNGDAYGWVRLTCEECDLVQKHGWDDK